MIQEKIFKRSCGARVKVEVAFVHDEHGRLNPGRRDVYHRYDVRVSFCLKGKRIFHQDDSVATLDEIEQVKLELWRKLKP